MYPRIVKYKEAGASLSNEGDPLATAVATAAAAVKYKEAGASLSNDGDPLPSLYIYINEPEP